MFFNIRYKVLKNFFIFNALDSSYLEVVKNLKNNNKAKSSSLKKQKRVNQFNKNIEILDNKIFFHIFQQLNLPKFKEKKVIKYCKSLKLHVDNICSMQSQLEIIEKKLNIDIHNEKKHRGIFFNNNIKIKALKKRKKICRYLSFTLKRRRKILIIRWIMFLLSVSSIISATYIIFMKYNHNHSLLLNI